MNKPITLCDRCKEYAHCCLSYDGYNCQKNRTVEPSHADLIRSMTDEELAEWIFRNQMHIFKIVCDVFGYTEYYEKKYGEKKIKMENYDDILAWLKQEN